MPTKSLLQHLLSDIETHHVERTTLISNRDKFCQATYAFPLMFLTIIFDCATIKNSRYKMITQ